MIELRSFVLLAAAVVPAILVNSACSSDASLGRDRMNDLATSGTSNAGSSGSGNASSGSGNSSGSSGGGSGGSPSSSGAGSPSGEGGSGGAERGLGGASGDGGDGPNLDDLNTDCPADNVCSEGLTPVHFYGVAGEAGPEFCWCTIPCDDNPNVCPETTTCTATGDGPGTVCFAN